MKRLWTTCANLAAATVTLVFGVLFSSETSASIFEKMEMRQLLRDIVPCFRKLGDHSAVARGTADLVETVLAAEHAAASRGSKLEVDEVIAVVERCGLNGVAPSFLHWSQADETQQYAFANLNGWEDFTGLGLGSRAEG